eukprot:758814-Hanusia_phi.AAC.2
MHNEEEFQEDHLYSTFDQENLSQQGSTESFFHDEAFYTDEYLRTTKGKMQNSTGFGVEHAIAFIDSLTLGESSQLEEEQDDHSVYPFDDVNSKYSILKCKKSRPVHLWRNWSIYHEGHAQQSFGSIKHKRQAFYFWSQFSHELIQEREASAYKILSCRLALMLREAIGSWWQRVEYQKINQMNMKLMVSPSSILSSSRELSKFCDIRCRQRF